MLKSLIVNNMVILAYGGRTPNGLSDGEGEVGVSTTLENIMEQKKKSKKKSKKKYFISTINFLLIYLHISNLLLTFAA